MGADLGRNRSLLLSLVFLSLTACMVSSSNTTSPFPNLNAPTQLVISSDLPLQKVTTDYTHPLSVTGVEVTPSGAGFGASGSGLTAPQAGTTGIGSPTTGVGVLGNVSSTLTVADLGAGFSAVISVTSSFPKTATQACKVLDPYSSVTCKLAGFPFANSSITGSNFQIQGYASNGTPRDILNSNALSTQSWVLERISKISGANDAPSNFKLYQNAFYFTANNASGVSKFYKMNDGGSILPFTNIRGTGATDLPATGVVNYALFGGNLFFNALNSVGGNKLFKTDGTTLTQVSALSSTTNDDLPNNFASDGTSLFFTGQLAGGIGKVFSTDGATNVTLVSNTLNNAGVSDAPANLTALNGSIYFSATDAASHVKLFKWTASTITKVSNLVPGGLQNDNPQQLLVYNNKLYFVALDSSGSSKIFQTTDGTSFTQVSNTSGGAALDDSPLELTLFNNLIYFTALDSTASRQLYSTNGTTVTQLSNDVGGKAPKSLTVFNNELYFSGKNTSGVTKLIKLGTAGYTVLSNTSQSLTNDDKPTSLNVVGNELYFVGLNSNGKEKLYKTDGTNFLKLPDINAAAYSDFNAINPSCSATHPMTMVSFAGAIYFNAYSDFIHCYENLFRLRVK